MYSLSSEFKYKQVIILRADLKMSPGKAVAQGGHAVFSSVEEARRSHPQWVKKWMTEGQCKVVLRVDSERELLRLRDEVEAMGLPHALIEDRGLTELKPGTVTCLGVGPAPSALVDKITGQLRLY